MPGLVGYGVHLDALRDHELLLALVNQCGGRVEELACFDGLDHFGFLEIDGDRGKIAAVQDAGHEALAAGFTGAAGADALTHVNIE